MARRGFAPQLPAPFLRRLCWRDQSPRPTDYPFTLPWLRDPDWQLDFTTPVTILVGENGTGKSTLIAAIAAIAGYDEAGSGKGYRAVNHDRALEASGAALADYWRAGCCRSRALGWTRWIFAKPSTFCCTRRSRATRKALSTRLCKIGKSAGMPGQTSMTQCCTATNGRRAVAS